MRTALVKMASPAQSRRPAGAWPGEAFRSGWGIRPSTLPAALSEGRDGPLRPIRIDRIAAGVPLGVAVDEADLARALASPPASRRLWPRSGPSPWAIGRAMRSMPSRSGVVTFSGRRNQIQRHSKRPEAFGRQRAALEQAEPQQRLEPVADAEHGPPTSDEAGQRLAQRLQAVCPERARAEMVAEGEATGQHDQRKVVQRAASPPASRSRWTDSTRAPASFQRQCRLAVAVRARRTHDERSRPGLHDALGLCGRGLPSRSCLLHRQWRLPARAQVGRRRSPATTPCIAQAPAVAVPPAPGRSARRGRGRGLARRPRHPLSATSMRNRVGDSAKSSVASDKPGLGGRHGLQVDLQAIAAGDRHLGRGDRQPALAQVVARLNEPGADGAMDSAQDAPRLSEMDARRPRCRAGRRAAAPASRRGRRPLAPTR